MGKLRGRLDLLGKATSKASRDG